MAHRPHSDFEARQGYVLALDVRGDRLAAGGADGSVKLFSRRGGVEAAWQDHRDLVNSVRFSHRGRVVSGSKDGTIRAWEPDGSSVVIGRHDNWVMEVAWDPEGERVASVSEDGTLRIWDGRGAELLRINLEAPANSVDWSPEGTLVAVAGGDRVLRLLDSGDGEEVAALRGAGQMLWSVRFSPSGKQVAWAGRDRKARIADVTGETTAVLEGHGQQVWSVSWHPDGDRLATASADRSARLWSSQGTPLEVLEGADWVRAAAWWGEDLVIAGDDGKISLYRDDGRPAGQVAPAPPVPDFEVCPHFDPQVFETSKTRCEECGSTESLRLCLSCGHVGCCESQLGHGTKHWEEKGHPNTTPTPPGRFPWRWCYECDDYVKRTT
ncbi:MAG: UBP-type zinc finger domain-containing protein [Acidimicrobiia bacterium]